MLIDEIDNFLDRYSIISFYNDLPITRFLRTNNIVAAERIRVNKDGGFIIINFPKGEHDDSFYMKELSSYETIITSDSVKVKVDISGTNFLEIFTTLNGVPSVVIDAVVFHHGFHFIHFRFHSADEDVLTRIIREKIVDTEGFTIRFLGKTPGIKGSFSSVSSILPLTYIEIQGTVPNQEINLIGDPVISNLGVSWYREMKYVMEDEIRAVFYDKFSLMQGKKQWINEISAENRIYETSFSNPVLRALIAEASKESVVTLGMPQKMYGKYFYISTVVPDICLPGFFRALYTVIRTHASWKLDIFNVSSFKDM